jgi:hypothetical protein
MSLNPRDVVIIDGVRTAMGRSSGVFRTSVPRCSRPS